MSQSASVWWVLAVCVIAANLPFVNERLFALFPLRNFHKALGWRTLELVVLYAASLSVGWLFERRLGQVASQGWEFYAVTGSLFLVLAFPGFTWRYLLKPTRARA